MRKATLILAATVVLFGCGKDETATSTTTQTTSTTASTATTAPPPPSSQPAAGAIAATDGEKPGMHIDVTELKRASGGTVNLKFVLTNSTSEKPSFWDYLHEKDTSSDAYDVSGVHLVDPVNKKKYFVVVDTEKKCLCSGKLDHMEPNSKVNLWAKFPAPPPEVTKVTVEIPHFQPVDDVPISQ